MKLLWYLISLINILLILFIDSKSDNVNSADVGSIFMNNTTTSKKQLRQIILFTIVIFFILTVMNVLYL
uniref:Preprotein-translocase subunit g n=1 Tax=Crouania attenuata TaxID=42002 RepID=A0A4D6WPH6_9FLOR|nr:Preprotein-translocase subunit g [Crouania attenuata]